MADNIRIRIDTSVVERGLAHVTKEIPFALSVAINACALDARDELRTTLPDYFHVRSKWTAGSMATNFSDKRHLLAEVGSRQEYMRLQGEGGARPESKGGGADIPTEAMRGAGGMGKTPRGKWPGQLANRKDGSYFFGTKPGGQQFLARKIGQRTPRERERAGRTGPVLPRYPIEVVYWISKDAAKIDPKWPIDVLVSRACARNYEKHASKAIEKALATMRP